MLCFSPRLEMGPVWWISCTWEQYIELHVCPALRRDTFLFHMFVQLRDPRKPNSGVCLRRQIGIVLCACKCLPPPCLPQPLCVCMGGPFPAEHTRIPLKPKSTNTRYLFAQNPQGGNAALVESRCPLGWEDAAGTKPQLGRPAGHHRGWICGAEDAPQQRAPSVPPREPTGAGSAPVEKGEAAHLV